MPTPHIDALIDLAFAEDIGVGDVTTEALIPPTVTATGALIARSPLTLCGIPLAERLLWRYGPGAPAVRWTVADGAQVEGGTVVGHLEGPLDHVLVVERPLLNFMQRMSAVATLTRRYVEAVQGTSAQVVCTRKTLPGWRALDKYAVRIGGGRNHRGALDSGILIKDNHLAAAGGIAVAVEQARARAPHPLRIEIEVEDLQGLEVALEAGADVVLIDNFTPEQAAEAVAQARGRALIEASGGVDLSTVAAFARAGVDLIAIGALTHSATAVDLSLEVLADE
ncbi:MAG: carboxylating nicotinate-nucleotide diphosphorylase [Bradymonadia bacterium]